MGKSGLTPQMVIEAVNEIFTDAVIATDVGQNQLWRMTFSLTSKVFGAAIIDYDGTTILKKFALHRKWTF